MKRALILALVFGLTACASADKGIVVPTTNTVEVQVPCKTAVVPNDPLYPDTDAKLKTLPWPSALADLKADPKNTIARLHVQQNIYYLMRLLSAGRPMRDGYIDQLKTTIRGCA